MPKGSAAVNIEAVINRSLALPFQTRIPKLLAAILGNFLGINGFVKAHRIAADTVRFSSTVSAPGSCPISSAPTSEFALGRFDIDLLSALLRKVRTSFLRNCRCFFTPLTRA